MMAAVETHRELLIVLALLGAAVLMFIRNRPRMDAVALLMILALPLTGVISTTEALAGFSDPAVILIALLFVVGDSLARTGVAQRLGDWMSARAGASEVRLIVLLMVSVAGIGALMSSTAVVAIFIPIVLRISRQRGIPPGRLMMPLSMAGLLSGMMTLVATPPNLVVNGELMRRGLDGLHFFSFTPFGLPMLAVGIVYMLYARRWLVHPASSESADTEQAQPLKRMQLSDWIEKYGLREREHRLRLGADSLLAGRTLEQLDLRGSTGVNILAIERGAGFRRELLQPAASTALQAGDILFIDVFLPSVDIQEICRRFRLEPLALSGTFFLDQSQQIGMAEVMIPESSDLIGKTVAQARFRSRHDLAVLGIARGKDAHAIDVTQETLKLGDTLLLVGPWRAIRRLQAATRDVIVLNLPAELDEVLPAATRAPHALLGLAIMVALMVSGVVSNVQAALFVCLLLGLMRCIDLDSAYRSIHWQSLVLIVGMLPFALALQKTGGIDIAAAWMLEVAGHGNPRILLAAIFLMTALFGLFISNTATAVLMAPVALAVADAMGLSPYPFAMTVALAASSALMTPVSSPVNTLVIGPGNYRFIDFVRVGVPFALICLVMTVSLVPLLMPF